MFVKNFHFLSVLFVFACLGLGGCKSDKEKTASDPRYKTWSSYLGDTGRSHYSTLSQITKHNVKGLKVAWSYEAPDWGQMQMNPLVVDSILYGVTAALRVIALNAETGKEIWQFGIRSRSGIQLPVAFPIGKRTKTGVF